MQDPERFLDGGTEFERALLRGGAAERPSARTVRRMALGAGVGGALSYTSSAQALLETWWGKAAAVAVVGGGALAGVAVAVAPDGPESSMPGRASPPALAATSPRAPEPSRPEQPPQPIERELGSELPEQPPAPAAAVPAEAATSKRALRTSPAASTLGDEIKLLDRARGLLARGDRAAALAELDGYDRRYPAGTLRREASVLRARATEP